MDTGSTDDRLREAFRRMAPPVDAASFCSDLEASLRSHEARRKRHDFRSLRIALYTSMALIVVAGIALTGQQIADHLGADRHTLIITDPGTDTTAFTPTTPGGHRVLWTLDRWEYSSPVVSGAMFYFLHVGGYLVAVDGGTGKEQWRFEPGGGLQPIQRPAVTEDLVFMGSSSTDRLYALGVEDGGERWSYRIGTGLTYPPVAADGTVYQGGDRTMYALDAESGRLRWKSELGGQIMSSPTIADGILYVGASDGYLYALDGADGRELWKSEDTSDSPPLVSEGVVYVRPSQNVEKEGVVYVRPNGHLRALDGKTGETRWEHVPDLPGPMELGRPYVADGKVFVAATGSDPRKYLLALDAETGQELWRFAREVMSFEIVGYTDGVLVSAVEGWSSPVYALDGKTGEVRWQGGAMTPPAVSDGVVYVGDYKPVVRALQARTGTELWRLQVPGSPRERMGFSAGLIYYTGEEQFYVVR